MQTIIFINGTIQILKWSADGENTKLTNISQGHAIQTYCPLVCVVSFRICISSDCMCVRPLVANVTTIIIINVSDCAYVGSEEVDEGSPCLDVSGAKGARQYCWKN